jgi:hypothetical protein
MEPTAGRQVVADPPIYVVAKTLIAPHRPLPRVLAAALEAGADGVEFPQEVVPLLMNPDDAEDLPQFSAPPVLAAQQSLFAVSQVRHDALLTTVLQSRALGCRLVTFPLGDVSQLTSETLDALHVALDVAHTQAPAVRVTVANEQTPASADLAVWLWLCERTSSWERPVHLTFDLGNWERLGVDAVSTAKALGQYVAYIRVGQNAVTPAKRVEDIPLTRILELLPPDVPRALAPEETTADYAQVVAVLRESVNTLRGEVL